MNDNWFLICDLSLQTIFFPIHGYMYCEPPITLKLRGIFNILIMHIHFLCILDKKNMMKCYITLTLFTVGLFKDGGDSKKASIGTIIPYLKKIRKLYESPDTTLENCFDKNGHNCDYHVIQIIM